MKHSYVSAAQKVVSIAVMAMLSAPAFATFQAVPEPSTLLLLAGGVGAALIIGKFKGRK
ncbi:PEP-CTERM sorting domain-containing protein [Sedimenticola sp.]|uniref:PEP-CTERM sorting domain-containing protein n=1 Tax=Sedimenticola sp. TaxID=1940285 RepID=UPI003D0F5AF3